MSSPIAVLISDIHYSINTLELADAALNKAIQTANDLIVPLIIAGDLHDTKANLRGECVKTIMDTMEKSKTQCFIIRGNHDQINERSEEHSLEFLRHFKNVELITSPISKKINNILYYLIPYHHDSVQLMKTLDKIDKNIPLIMHQGVEFGISGEYIQDKSALKKDDLVSRNIISGHYHTRQKISLPNKGSFSYIGNPYTLNWAEAKDPEKGFQILNDDGTLSFIPTKLRRHFVIECADKNWEQQKIPNLMANDLLWVKMSISNSDTDTSILREKIKRDLKLECSIRIDFIPKTIKHSYTEMDSKVTDRQLLDSVIDSLEHIEKPQKDHIKSLWKNL